MEIGQVPSPLRAMISFTREILPQCCAGHSQLAGNIVFLQIYRQKHPRVLTAPAR